jgi:uncharacterized protein with NRDE domain
MCLAVVALDAHPRYAVVLAANRDEYHARPTQAAHWWRDADASPILAGRDLAQGGTWLGVTPAGRFAFVTNVREPSRHDAFAPSRGALVPALLRDARPVVEAMRDVVANGEACNGFNLVGVAGLQVAFGSNRGPRAQSLAPGLHGVSNAGLDTPWPKLLRTKAGVAQWVADGDDAIDRLWTVLADTTRADDDVLPCTGVTRGRERLLSSPFIVSDTYGTRSSTIVTIDREGQVAFVERTFDATGAMTSEASYRFRQSDAGSESAIARCGMPASSNTSPQATNP